MRWGALLEGGRSQAGGGASLEAVGWGMVREFLQKESWLLDGKWISREAGPGASLEEVALVWGKVTIIECLLCSMY